MKAGDSRLFHGMHLNLFFRINLLQQSTIDDSIQPGSEGLCRNRKQRYD